MSGVKGRSGKGSGGVRRGSGPHRRRLQLSAEQAKSLALLTKLRRSNLDKPELSEEDVVSWLVEREWESIEAAMLPRERVEGQRVEDYIL